MTNSNPEIIDLASWQQVTSDVQIIKDRLDNITTNYGAGTASAGDWNVSATLTHEFNLGTQKIISGRYKFIVADNPPTSTKLYYADIPFGTSFAAKPIITATVQFGSQTVPPGNTNVVCVVYGVDVDGFSIRLVNAGSSAALSGYFYINWMAIGPK